MASKFQTTKGELTMEHNRYTIGFILDILIINNGIILTFFKYIKIGFIKDNQGFGYFYTIMLAIGKLELSTSIAWRTKAHEENQEVQTSEDGEESEAPIASA